VFGRIVDIFLRQVLCCALSRKRVAKNSALEQSKRMLWGFKSVETKEDLTHTYLITLDLYPLPIHSRVDFLQSLLHKTPDVVVL
jgi:hypothetical protein